MQEFLQYLFSGITNGAIYAVIALGFSTLYSATDLINFAQGEFVMLGALLLMTLWTQVSMPLWAAFPLAVLLVAAVGMVFDRVAIKTVKKPSPILLVLITVGASILFRGGAMLLWGKHSYSVPAFSSISAVEIGGAYLFPQSLWILGVVLVLVAGLNLFYHRTLTGKAMQAVAINKQAAELLGVASRKMTLLAWGLAAGLGAVAGVIISPITMSAYDMGTMLGLKGFCAAMLGGLGNFWGAVVGGVLLGLTEAMGVGYVSSSLKDAIAFLLLLLILYAKPTGILGKASSHRF
ncbi:MAG: branched-chain amino acid ABC transporter permease [Deltaproteobacteria bacterium]|nr:branched-chain amino acid ABC transporter permease [Deltaproteobacteria bacterium]